MNADGETAIKEILELLNNGWTRDGHGCYYQEGCAAFLPRSMAIEVQRGCPSTLEICGVDSDNP